MLAQAAIWYLFSMSSVVEGFSPPRLSTHHRGRGDVVARIILPRCSVPVLSASENAAVPTSRISEWVPLGRDDCVRKRILVPGTGDIVLPGAEVAIEYRGTLAALDWSPNDVVECWLTELQGLESLAPAFLENDIDGEKLMDESIFTEEFVESKLGVSNRIQCKKLLMASRRLAKDREEYPVGTEFDSSSATTTRGDGGHHRPYRFTLGSGKVISATNAAVESMRLGEFAEIITKSNHAYGKDGLRSIKGVVMIPPFATLRFEIRLIEC